MNEITISYCQETILRIGTSERESGPWIPGEVMSLQHLSGACYH